MVSGLDFPFKSTHLGQRPSRALQVTSTAANIPGLADTAGAIQGVWNTLGASAHGVKRAAVGGAPGVSIPWDGLGVFTFFRLLGGMSTGFRVQFIPGGKTRSCNKHLVIWFLVPNQMIDIQICNLPVDFGGFTIYKLRQVVPLPYLSRQMVSYEWYRVRSFRHWGKRWYPA